MQTIFIQWKGSLPTTFCVKCIALSTETGCIWGPVKLPYHDNHNVSDYVQELILKVEMLLYKIGYQ